MDRIIIKDLLVRCIIGVNDEERQEAQDVIINLSLFINSKKAGKSDQIEDTVDYHIIKNHIMSESQTWRFHLIEALAETIAGICLEYHGVRKVTVRVEKPSALRFSRSVSVEITRGRKK